MYLHEQLLLNLFKNTCKLFRFIPLKFNQFLISLCLQDLLCYNLTWFLQIVKHIKLTVIINLKFWMRLKGKLTPKIAIQWIIFFNVFFKHWILLVFIKLLFFCGMLPHLIKVEGTGSIISSDGSGNGTL